MRCVWYVWRIVVVVAAAAAMATIDKIIVPSRSFADLAWIAAAVLFGGLIWIYRQYKLDH